MGVEMVGVVGECVVAYGEEEFGSVGCVDGLVLGLVGEVWVRWSEWVSVGEVVSGGGRVYGSGGTGYSPGIGRGRSGSGCVWLWLPTSGFCRLASLG